MRPFCPSDPGLPLQRFAGSQAYFQCSSPFLRKGSCYALDISTAVAVICFHEQWSEAEIEAEINKHLSPFFLTGPRLITIKRWLSAFRRDASEYTSFFTKQLLENHLAIPAKIALEKQAQTPDYTCRYFLECMASLYGQLHPKTKSDGRFLMHANSLIRTAFKSELFRNRSP